MFHIVNTPDGEPNSIVLSSRYSQRAILLAFADYSSIRVLKLDNLPPKFPKKMIM